MGGTGWRCDSVDIGKDVSGCVRQSARAEVSLRGESYFSSHKVTKAQRSARRTCHLGYKKQERYDERVMSHKGASALYVI